MAYKKDLASFHPLRLPVVDLRYSKHYGVWNQL